MQKKALETYIARCDDLKTPALAPQLINAAQTIIDSSLAPDQEPTPLSKNWLARYIKKHPHMRRIRLFKRVVFCMQKMHAQLSIRELRKRERLLRDVLNALLQRREMRDQWDLL